MRVLCGDVAVGVLGRGGQGARRRGGKFRLRTDADPCVPGFPWPACCTTEAGDPVVFETAAGDLLDVPWTTRTALRPDSGNGADVAERPSGQESGSGWAEHGEGMVVHADGRFSSGCFADGSLHGQATSGWLPSCETWRQLAFEDSTSWEVPHTYVGLFARDVRCVPDPLKIHSCPLARHC